MLNVIVGKIATNLKCYVEVTIYNLFQVTCIVLEIKIVPFFLCLPVQNADVITHTLKLFLEMASGLVFHFTVLSVGVVLSLYFCSNMDPCLDTQVGSCCSNWILFN